MWHGEDIIFAHILKAYAFLNCGKKSQHDQSVDKILIYKCSSVCFFEFVHFRFSSNFNSWEDNYEHFTNDNLKAINKNISPI